MEIVNIGKTQQSNNTVVERIDEHDGEKKQSDDGQETSPDMLHGDKVSSDQPKPLVNQASFKVMH